MNPERISLKHNAVSPMLVVGSIAYDNIITPMRSGTRILGGSASYASLAASYYTSCRLVGVVGHDFSDGDIARLEARGICLTGLQKDETGPTLFWEGKYHENFNSRDTLNIQLNVFEKYRPLLPESYRKTEYTLLANIGPDLQNHVCDQLTTSKYVVADSMDLWIETKRDDLLRLLKRIDCFIINDSEATLLTGQSNLITAGQKLLDLGPKTTIIKKGEHGAYLFHANGLFALPAFPVTNLQDPTGAGDSFAGAFTAFLAATDNTSFENMKHAIAYATVTASLTVEAFSCDRLESAGPMIIEERYNELLQITRI